MNEIPETLTLARQIRANLTGKTITAVTAAASPLRPGDHNPKRFARSLTEKPPRPAPPDGRIRTPCSGPDKPEWDVRGMWDNNL